MDSTYVIDSSKLIYEPYHQSRGDGFSGQLLLATNADNPDEKYILKAGTAHVAACEFMFYSLAVKLGLRTARVWLVKPAKPHEFEYPACAVEFIPNAVKLKYDEFMQIEECEILSHLSYILGDRDNLDFLKDSSGVVYKIDHSDCFGIEDTAETWLDPQNVTLSYMIYQMAKSKPNVGHYAEKTVLRDMFGKLSKLSMTDFDDELTLISRFCGKSFEAHFRHYIGDLIEQSRQVGK